MVRAPELVPSLLEMGAQSSRITVTPSGLRDESLGHYDGLRFKQKYGLTGSPMVLFLGRMNPLKGPQVLIGAIPKIRKEFPAATFAFVGPDQGDYGSVLKKQVNQLGVAEGVRFTGPIYELTEKMQAYAACDLFVLPTSYEGTSQAIFEAMGQGKPIIATRTGGIPSQVQDGVEGLLLPYGDPQVLAEAILSVLGNKDTMNKMSANARAKAENYRYSNLAKQVEELYTGLKAN
jgi:glycosyltransferase involved in cell wall biosynthesis